MRAVLTDRLVVCALACAVALRLAVAVALPYLPDESERSIPLADEIASASSIADLPLRGPEHPALPSYVVAASQSLFGTSPLGRRTLHLWMGLLMIVVVAAIAFHWQGIVVARWASWLMAFNEYHIGVSAYATAKAPHLLAVALSLWAFSRALTSHRPADLWMATAWVAVACYAKEYAALLLPIYAVALWLPGLRGTFRLSHQVVAALVFLVLMTPDIVWHLLPRPGDQRWTIQQHLARVSIDVNLGYLMFYLRDVMQAGHHAMTGLWIADGAVENPSMNSLMGALLLAGVVWTTGRSTDRSVTRQALLLTFWPILAFFVCLAPEREHLTPSAWYWVDMTLFPATLCAAAWAASATGRLRWGMWGLAGAAMAYAAYLATLGGFLFDVTVPITGAAQ